MMSDKLAVLTGRATLTLAFPCVVPCRPFLSSEMSGRHGSDGQQQVSPAIALLTGPFCWHAGKIQSRGAGETAAEVPQVSLVCVHLEAVQWGPSSFIIHQYINPYKDTK